MPIEFHRPQAAIAPVLSPDARLAQWSRMRTGYSSCARNHPLFHRLVSYQAKLKRLPTLFIPSFATSHIPAKSFFSSRSIIYQN
jgi:hypothetical protein